MPPRPAGTDGTDHSYREVIADRYKRMAQYKDSIEKLIGLHILFVLVKLAWHYTAFATEGLEIPNPSLGMAAGEVLLLLVYYLGKLGTVKENLTILKTFNMVQAGITATEVLTAWAYHQGTHTGGEPTYVNSMAVAKYVTEKYPGYSAETVVTTLKGFELFLDFTLAAFLAMGTFVAHKMIVEKMEMKKDRKKVSTDRKDAQKGGSDDESEDDDDAPSAVPLQEDKPNVVKAAATSRTQAARRRHA